MSDQNHMHLIKTMFLGKVRNKSVQKKDIQVSIIADDYVYDFINEIHNHQMKLFDSFCGIL